jgi:hypothetical protein
VYLEFLIWNSTGPNNLQIYFRTALAS